jgi:signal peptidase I
MKKILLFTGLGVFALIAFAMTATAFLDPYQVGSHSMTPTYPVGTRVMVSVRHYQYFEVKRGDVVLFQPNDSLAEPWMHRVVAVPGDRVVIDGGILAVNDEPVLFPEAEGSDSLSIVVPEGLVFQKGDHPMSFLSLEPQSSIIGKIVGTY